MGAKAGVFPPYEPLPEKEHRELLELLKKHCFLLLLFYYLIPVALAAHAGGQGLGAGSAIVVAAPSSAGGSGGLGSVTGHKRKNSDLALSTTSSSNSNIAGGNSNAVANAVANADLQRSVDERDAGRGSGGSSMPSEPVGSGDKVTLHTHILTHHTRTNPTATLSYLRNKQRDRHRANDNRLSTSDLRTSTADRSGGGGGGGGCEDSGEREPKRPCFGDTLIRRSLTAKGFLLLTYFIFSSKILHLLCIVVLLVLVHIMLLLINVVVFLIPYSTTYTPLL